MKLIIAYIQPHKLSDVKQTLYREEVYKMSVTNSLGCGQQKGYHESYRGVGIEVNLLKKIRLEIAATARYSYLTCPNASVSEQVNGAKKLSDSL
jgi:nitrogen regulatory protein P-II 2